MWAGIMTFSSNALAGQLLQAFYTAAKRVAGPDVQARMRGALAACFERGPTDVGYVAALQQLALADRGAAGSVTVHAAAAAAKASGGLQAGALQVPKSALCQAISIVLQAARLRRSFYSLLSYHYVDQVWSFKPGVHSFGVCLRGSPL